MSAPVLRVERWQRHGHDRLYVSPAGGGRAIGWWNLKTGEAGAPVDEQHRAAFHDAVGSWIVEHLESKNTAPVEVPGGAAAAILVDDPLPRLESARVVPPPVVPPPRRSVETVVGDLAGRRPGEGIQALADALRAKHPIWFPIARLLGIKTAEWSWRVGAAGERAVGRRLDRLQREGWRVLHSVPLGKGGDLDHLIIGPGGVYVVNSKCHRGRYVVVGDKAVIIGRYATKYVAAAQRESYRAAAALTAACGDTVPVLPLLAIHGARRVHRWRRNRPGGVQVMPSRGLRRWLRKRARESVLSPAAVEWIYAAARRSSTWSSA